ncbi:GFA family protein [Phyllobacterium sp. A18/5-2]|jgi:hypothetical protein|uniref:GFA family protein n=1 Tax=Phyllobacterium sp. A18/5-2 TaxID=2978392 RepID=UPI0021C76427|nr:GFA family protein [Phyllobacterium sp. A18/5-2]UXN64848.1 GFA family protein [Phyllobacterium sp. A18/5-2]
MKVDGACHCRRITFTCDADPDEVSICHCTDCQILTGTAFRTSVPVAADNFHILSGSPKTYIKIAASGARRVQAFCGECGTPIYATSDSNNPSVYGVRVGTLDQRSQLPPTHAVWQRSALPWVPAIAGITVYDEEDG